jgi:hypothetical protein
LVISVLSAILAGWLLFRGRREFSEACNELRLIIADRARLEHLNPFPNAEAARKTKATLEIYRTTVNKGKEELSAQVLPQPPLAPNEFQSRVRLAILSLSEKAQVSRVKLPENFCLGFDEFTSSLPDTAASPLLGQQLSQTELLLSILIDSRVDAIAEVKRVPTLADSTPAAVPTRKTATKPTTVIERTAVDLRFTASPSALRKVLNEIASADHQFFIVRRLHVHNEKQKPPAREETARLISEASPAAIKFIVGAEHLEVAARVELIRFNF